MKIIFMGSPDFAVPSLEALVGAGHDVVAAYCQPPRPAGRGKAERRTAIHERAEALGIPVHTPRSLRDEPEQAEFAGLDADLAVVAAYGLILPKPILEAPKEGCINVHASLLPRWRGAAPIQRAILAGDEDIGVCIMQMDAGLDTGPVRLCRKSWIGVDNAGKVADRLSRLGAELLIKVLGNLDAYPPVPQAEEGVTYARKIDKAETRLDFDNAAPELERAVKAFAPSPGAWFEIDGERIRVLGARWLDRENGKDGEPGVLVDRAWSCKLNPLAPASSSPSPTIAITCSLGYLGLDTVQPAGKKPMSASEFLRGRPHLVGTRVG